MTLPAQYRNDSTIKIVRGFIISITEDAPFTASNLPRVSVLNVVLLALMTSVKTT